MTTTTATPRFTPGPWRRRSHRQIVAPGDLPLCEAFSGSVGIEQADANEHLIAAAPDMFVALHAALVALTGSGTDPAHSVELRIIRNTLARALGISADRWTPALFLVDKRVMILPDVRSEADAMQAAETAASARNDVEWIAARPANKAGCLPPDPTSS